MTRDNPYQKKFLSYEDIDIVIEIVNKYNLGPIPSINNPELKKMLSKAKTPEERVEIIENLPFNKIMDRLEEILKGEISLEDLPSLLKKDLDLPLFTAEKIAKEIKERIFSITPGEKEKISEKPPTPKGDIYREPIE
jgi:hypothetical protein